MRKFSQALLVSTCLTLLCTQPVLAEDAESADRSDIVVTAAITRENAAATGLPLTLRETPQSVTVIDRQRIDDFALTNVNDLLSQAVGINVERTETDRTEFTARGFDITNFQVDGIGLPLRWGIQFGDMDTILYDRVEAVRGANAIMTGIGNPSATINYVRKRPTKEFRASATAMLGSWDQKRFEGDVSGALNASGTLSARLVYAHDDKDSYLRYNHVNRDVYGAFLAWEVTPGLTFSAGYTRQENNSDGVLWGALPLLYSNGTRIDYPVSATTAADWTFWNITDQSAFAELAYASDGGWQARARFTYNKRNSLSKLLYAFGYPDAATGIGVGGMTGIYRSPMDQYLGDVYASGPIRLFGREHTLALGFSTAKVNSKEYEAFSDVYPDYASVNDWAVNGIQPAQPSYPDEYLAENVNDRLTRVYGAIHANLADPLKLVAGASVMWLDTTGQSYAVDQARSNSKISPYAGLVFDVTKNVSFYASYTDIYNPQKEADAQNRRLDPAKGTSIEGGIKSEWLDKRLYVSAAIFHARQSNLAEQIGVSATGKGIYGGTDVTSKGFEIEVTGQISENWTVSGGYTGLKITDANGNRTRAYLPTKSLKLATTYSIPRLQDLKLGAQFRWQNAISTLDTGVVDYGIVADPVTITQKGYAVLDLMAAIRIVDHVRASINVRNVTDTKYLNSLKWGQAFFGAPRSVLGSISFTY